MADTSHIDLASTLLGKTRIEDNPSRATNTVLYTGTATTDSADGSVTVDLDGDVVEADDAQDTSTGDEPAGVEIDTDADVRAGDIVAVAFSGKDNTARTMRVIGALGGGDRTRAEINTVSSEVSNVFTSLEQYNDYFQLSINTVNQDLTERIDSADANLANTNAALNEEINTRKSYMQFGETSGNPTLVLGSTDSKAKAALTNQELDFTYEDQIKASVGQDGMSMPKATISDSLQIGEWMWFPRSNGNLSLKWVGNGAENLLTGTQTFDGFYTANDVSLVNWTDDGTTYQGCKVLYTHAMATGATKDYNADVGIYTFSVWAKRDATDNDATESERTVSIYAVSDDGRLPQAVVDPASAVLFSDASKHGWARYSLTFNVTTAGILTPCVRKANQAELTSNLYIAGYMLERGAVAHVWASAPADSE